MVQRRLVLHLERTLVGGALLQPLPIAAHGLRELLRQAQIVANHQRVAN